jgi:hypothetical protein
MDSDLSNYCSYFLLAMIHGRRSSRLDWSFWPVPGHLPASKTSRHQLQNRPARQRIPTSGEVAFGGMAQLHPDMLRGSENKAPQELDYCQAVSEVMMAAHEGRPSPQAGPPSGRRLARLRPMISLDTSMKIHSLRLKNIRCFEDTGDLLFSSRFNIFVGRNNSGKSTL